MLPYNKKRQPTHKCAAAFSVRRPQEIEMTAQDYISIYWEAQSAGISAVTLYISILSAYLIVFYVAGAKLNARQANFVTVLFVVFSALCVFTNQRHRVNLEI